jgi:hypothetical protein
LRLRAPRSNAFIGWKWESVPTAGPFFSRTGRPFSRDWDDDRILYLDYVIDHKSGFTATDVNNGTFTAYQQHVKRRRIEDELREYFDHQAKVGADYQAYFDARVAENAEQLEREHRKMNVRGEVLTREDINAALAAEPRMKAIVDHGGVKWADRVRDDAGYQELKDTL